MILSIADFDKKAPIFTALKYPNYRLWFWGQMFSLMGTWMQTTAQGWTMVTQQAYSEAYAPVRAANIRALAILAITLLAVLMVAYMLSERLSSPIRKLTEIANEMSRGRLFTDIPEAKRRDEIGALAAAIDRMGTSIRLAMERLRAKP